MPRKRRKKRNPGAGATTAIAIGSAIITECALLLSSAGFDGDPNATARAQLGG